MKIWQLTFLDSAYLKYESKLKLPLLPKNALISVFWASFSGFRPDYLRFVIYVWCSTGMILLVAYTGTL